MKRYIKFFFMFILSLSLLACAAGNIQIPEKYSLDGQLEQVSGIYKYTIMTWEKIDKQSLILQTSPSTYYLLVLKIPSPELLFRNRIILSSMGDMIRAGLDDVILYGGGHIRASYPIDRIYWIRGTEQMRAIRDSLTGETKGDHAKDRPSRTGIVVDDSFDI
jgi:hypothetical protein